MSHSHHSLCISYPTHPQSSITAKAFVCLNRSQRHLFIVRCAHTPLRIFSKCECDTQCGKVNFNAHHASSNLLLCWVDFIFDPLRAGQRNRKYSKVILKWSIEVKLRSHCKSNFTDMPLKYATNRPKAYAIPGICSAKINSDANHSHLVMNPFSSWNFNLAGPYYLVRSFFT